MKRLIKLLSATALMVVLLASTAVFPAFANHDTNEREQPGKKDKNTTAETNGEGWGIIGCKQRKYTHNDNCGWGNEPYA